MKIILLNKTYKYHKVVFARELAFVYIPKCNSTTMLEGTRPMLTSWLADKNTPSLQNSVPSTYLANDAYTLNQSSTEPHCILYSNYKQADTYVRPHWHTQDQYPPMKLGCEPTGDKEYLLSSISGSCLWSARSGAPVTRLHCRHVQRIFDCYFCDRLIFGLLFYSRIHSWLMLSAIKCL